MTRWRVMELCGEFRTMDLSSKASHGLTGWFMDLPSYSVAPSAFTFRNQAIGLLENFKASFNA